MVWRSFRDRLHGPSEKRLAVAMRKYLREAGERISKRLSSVLTKSVQRALTETQLNKILNDADEAVILGKITQRQLGAAYKSAFREAAKLLPKDKRIIFSPQRLNKMVESQIGDLIKTSFPNRREAVKKLIQKSLDEGRSVQQMQKLIRQSASFSASKALTVARTETTRAVNAGAVESYATAADLGIKVKMNWLTARDGGERHPSDLQIEEQLINPGDDFELDDGTTGPGPGQMGVAEHDINCRCTVIPVVGG